MSKDIKDYCADFVQQEEEEEEEEEEVDDTDSTIDPESYYVSSICSYRRALDSDIPEILTLVTNSTYDLFGYTSVEFKIKKCYFSMVAINADGRIVAVICLDDHPNIISIPKCDWESWIKNLYNLQNLTSQNTLFINLIAYYPSYIYGFEKPLLENVYLNFPYLIHLVVVVPGNSPSYSFMEENFTCIMPIGYTNPKKVQTLYLTFRHHYIQKFKIRLAVEEDNDDIVQIIDTHSKRLKEMYGEYYLSEILTKFPNMNRKVIVAEIAERAVGVLFLNDNVNYESLINNFCLEPFLNLHELGEGNMISEASFAQSISMEPDFEGTSMRTIRDDYSLPSLLRDDIEEESISDEELTIADLFDLERLGILVSENTELQHTNEDTKSNFGESVDDDPIYLGKTSSETDFLKPSLSIIRFKLPTEAATAFTLEIMAAEEEHERNILCDLLEASFQSFTNSDKKFCVFSVLHNIPHFPLFDYFVRSIPRRNSVYPHDVYVLHTNAVKAQLKVCKLSKRDYSKVKELVCNITNCTTVIDAITKSLYGSQSKLKSFIMLNMSVIIGIIIIQECPSEFYFDRFQCYKYVDENSHRYNRCGMIEYFILSPVFQKHVQFFLKEIHRLTDMSVLFYKMARLEVFQKTRTRPLPAILKDMIPVADRMLPKFTHMQFVDVDIPNCFIDRKYEPFSLFISTRRLTSLPRIDINSRIVVVGASCTGLSFLESIIFHFDGMKHVTFNNLYLIYDRTVARDRENLEKYIPHMFVYRGKFTGNHISAICFHAHVNYVNGFMTTINRKLKYITVNKETIMPYDYLFLMCGTQYNQPHARGVRKDKMSEACPQNVFVINKYRDADKAFEQIFNFMKVKRNPVIVVYGSCLNTYCCLSALEKLHSVKSNIKFVEPTPDEFERPYVDPFNNPEIFDTFHDILFLVGFEVYTGYYFYEWDVDPADNTVVSVKYQSRKGAISFNCDFIFHYANVEVNYDTFNAVNNAGLVYDGKLVIGPDCRTNDPCIFAAGPMTKYSRRYFADKFVHAYYNSHEIGERLGRQIRAMLLPGGLEENKGDDIFECLKTDKTNKLVPQYLEPRMENCILPGGINFLHIFTPGKQIPIETQRHIGYVFETGNLKKIELDEDPEYFRLQLNQQMKVEKIVCFTRKEIDVVNYGRLWGKHEQSLNNLVVRYKKGYILNFYQYFRTPYFCALYTDVYLDLQRNLENILTLLTSKTGRSVIEDVVSKLSSNNWKRLSKYQEKAVRKKFLKSDYHKQMVHQIMKFIGNYVNYLPMYAHPLITKLLLYDIEDSPLFTKIDSESYCNMYD